MWLAVPFAELCSCRSKQNFLPVAPKTFFVFFGVLCVFRWSSRREAAAKIFALGFETHHFVVVFTVLKLKNGL
jgi:hypothetical protein